MGTDLGFKSRIIGKTLVDGYHLPLPVDDKRCRDGFNTTVVRDNSLIAHSDSVVHPQFAHERLDYTGSLLVQRDPNDDQAFVLVFSLQCDKGRDLLAAWRALGSPKIQDHHLSFEIRKANRFAVDIAE